MQEIYLERAQKKWKGSRRIVFLIFQSLHAEGETSLIRPQGMHGTQSGKITQKRGSFRKWSPFLFCWTSYQAILSKSADCLIDHFLVQKLLLLTQCIKLWLFMQRGSLQKHCHSFIDQNNIFKTSLQSARQAFVM